MKPARHRQNLAPAAPQRGVALVLTLLIVAMLTVVVVGFNAATRTEQMAARNFSKLASGRSMVATAQQEAAALLASVLTNTSQGIVTQPGRALVWDATGAIKTNLLSTEGVPGASGERVDLNASGAIAGTSAASSNYFRVQWVNVTANVNGSNQIVGRYAFWIDDDGSRMNLNYAGANARANGAFYPTNARPFDARQLEFSPANVSNVFLTGLQSALTENSSSPRSNSPTWGYLFHPQQIRSFARNQSTVAASSLWNGLRYQVAGGAGNMTNAVAPAAMGRFDLGQGGFFTGTGTTLLQQVNNFVANRINAPVISNKFRASFTSKYNQNILRQIAVNINDHTLPTGSLSSNGQTALTGASLANALGIPTQFAGNRPYPFLNEISYRVGYTTNGLQPWFSGEVQIWIGAEVANPYNEGWGDLGAIVINEWGSIEVDVEYELNGAKQQKNFKTSPWIGFDPSNLRLSITSNLPADTFSSLSYAFQWKIEKSQLLLGAPAGAVLSNVKVSRVAITPGTISLRQWYDDPATVRDWALSKDFAGAGPAHFTFSAADIFAATSALGEHSGPKEPPTDAGTFFGAPGAKGIAKNDPRVKTFDSFTSPLPAWGPVGGAKAITMGANNSTVNMSGGTGISSLPNDRAPSSSNILNHPDFDVNLSSRLEPTTYLSAFELGKVHTGLQWRTLQMHAQEAAESAAGFVPDWALLDAFTVNDAFVPVAARLNPNALPYPAMTNGLTPSNSVAQGLSRSGSYAGLLSGFVTANQPGQARVRLLPGGALTNAGLSAGLNISNTAVTSASRAISTMGLNAAWRTRRATMPGFPTNAYGTLAEIVEVDGIGNRGTNKVEREQNARVVYESLSPFSDTFTVFAIGQGLEVTTFGGKTVTNVIGEARTMTQMKFDPASGKVRPVYTWPLN